MQTSLELGTIVGVDGSSDELNIFGILFFTSLLIIEKAILYLLYNIDPSHPYRLTSPTNKIYLTHRLSGTGKIHT